MLPPRRIALLSMIASAVAAFACGSSSAATTTTATPAPTPAQGPNRAPMPMGTTPAFASPPADSFAPLRARAVEAMMQRIAGKENMPAESVFTNVKVLRRVPAGRLLGIMNNGFGRSLGVSCGFCHVPGKWASDEKPTKQIARDMMAFSGKVNAELKNIPNLPDSNATVNCSTCHRGQAKPFPNGEARGG